MDRSYDGAYGRTSNTSSGRMLEGRPSFDRNSASMQATSSSRLQKKRSNAGVRKQSPGPLGFSSNNQPGTRTSNTPASSLAIVGKASRTGSIRSAMRKIFGKKSKDPDPEPIRASPPRHQYHRSESSALPPPIEVPEPGPSDSQYAFPSEPYQPTSPYVGKRQGSPYAVQFPKSAQLKPLDLGNPFATSNTHLRRRKTLPTILPAELARSESVPMLASTPLDAPPVPPVPPEIALAISEAYKPIDRERAARKSRRRSRSVEDLNRPLGNGAVPSRKRSEEIQYWRESIQGDTQRMSSVARRTPRNDVIGEREEDDIPTVRPDMFEEPRTEAAASYENPNRSSLLPVDEQDSDFPTSDLTKDLEDRVAKLEAGLRTFQRSLQRLTRDRNRGTVIMGNITARRSSDDVRTPSMLADTLLEFQESTSQSQIREPEISRRPSTSPVPDAVRRPEETFTPELPPFSPSARAPDPLRSNPPVPDSPPPRSPTRSISSSNRNSPPSQPQPRVQQPRQPQPQMNFRSLYQMLSDERSARHRLETEMRNLREELSDLHSQVASSSVYSNVHSQRSSYMPADPSAGSTRLRELLRETETQPSPTASHHQHHSSGGSSSSRWWQQQPQQASSVPPVPLAPSPQPSTGQRFPGLDTSGHPHHQSMISRFSGSDEESEGEGELETPLEAYQTPTEETGRWSSE